MNQNEARTFWISIAAALFAVFLLYSYTQEKSAELTKKFGAKQRVVIAVKDINEMETIDESMVQIVEKPVDFVEPKATADMETVVGQVALAPIKKDEQILLSKIIKPGPVTGLSLQVAPSKRAVAIPIDETRAVAKLLNPGDRIDIITALDVGKGANLKREVKTLMQDVVILSTGLRVANELPLLYEKIGREDQIRNLRGDTSFNTITVEASPKEAQDLIYILSTSPGSLFISLRHPSDRQKKPIPETTIESLIGQVTKSVLNQQQRVPASRPAPPPKPKPKKKSGPFIDL
ncbi:MAG TPA: Flp pilus assembly protein CpaB [Bdellovibrionales bacterium]|nr:Flp pilus assembly protein CpaB [Pseudobdellovibrionaceae bacterium]HAG91540.1 Flp pilus assembly protein CpaB [Bdellovibrionales bacterium]|tara:strand:+ start:2453 stop:3325 length:873 start_codon:yes stop_codon:yes gene_type:complete